DSYEGGGRWMRVRRKRGCRRRRPHHVALARTHRVRGADLFPRHGPLGGAHASREVRRPLFPRSLVARRDGARFCLVGRLGRSRANPAVSGPIEGGVHGYPWNHSLFALRGPGNDYTEQEFFFGGMATDLSTGVQAPYESRMLVRLPRNPADFSGIVTVEWLNVTGQMDLETSWPVEAQYLMGQGIGYVGVSAQLAGVCCGPTTLKGWDPVRYA